MQNESREQLALHQAAMRADRIIHALALGLPTEIGFVDASEGDGVRLSFSNAALDGGVNHFRISWNFRRGAYENEDAWKDVTDAWLKIKAFAALPALLREVQERIERTLKSELERSPTC
jgi:hypothetical protein